MMLQDGSGEVVCSSRADALHISMWKLLKHLLQRTLPSTGSCIRWSPLRDSKHPCATLLSGPVCTGSQAHLPATWPVSSSVNIRMPNSSHHLTRDSFAFTSAPLSWGAIQTQGHTNPANFYSQHISVPTEKFKSPGSAGKWRKFSCCISNVNAK